MTHSGKPIIIVPDCDFHALMPPSVVRQLISASASANNNAPKRSSHALVRSEALAVKKSTMMLPRRNWHHGRNSAIAAPAAAPVSSKSPTMVLPIVLRPITLTQVISVMAVSSTPAAIAHSLARNSRIFKAASPPRSLSFDGLRSGPLYAQDSILRFRQLDHQSVEALVQRDLAAQPAGWLARRGGHLEHLQLFVGRWTQLGLPRRVDDHVAGGAGEATAA